LRSALRLDADWMTEAQGSMSAEERKLSVVSVCLTMAHLLRLAAREFEAMDADDVDRLMKDERLMMLTVNRVGRQELRDRLDAIQGALEGAGSESPQSESSRGDLLLVAGLPLPDVASGHDG